MQVVLPYFKSKLHTVYNREREATLQASLWGHGNDRYDEISYMDENDSAFVSTSGSDAEGVGRTLRTRMQKIIAACYPWLHAGNEGAFNFTCFLVMLLLPHQ